jgi:glutathione S-transferase
MVDRLLDRPPSDKPGSLGYGSYDDVLNTLEKALAPGPFILGDQFSAADVYVGSQIGWGLMAKSLEPRPAFLAYMSRWNERPAFKRALERNAELVEQSKSGS